MPTSSPTKSPTSFPTKSTTSSPTKSKTLSRTKSTALSLKKLNHRFLQRLSEFLTPWKQHLTVVTTERTFWNSKMRRRSLETSLFWMSNWWGWAIHCKTNDLNRIWTLRESEISKTSIFGWTIGESTTSIISGIGEY